MGVLRLLGAIVLCWVTAASGAPPEATKTPAQYIEGETHHLLRPCFTSPDLCKFLSSRMYKGVEDYRNGQLRPGEEWRNEVIGTYGKKRVRKKTRRYRYKGVPAPIRENPPIIEPNERQANLGQSIQWVGYQPKAAFSRVFWLLSHIGQPVQVDRLSALKVVIRFPRTSVANDQLLRPLETQQFNGVIARVSATVSKEAIAYTIHLKRPAQHLYRFEGPYLIVDFEN